MRLKKQKGVTLVELIIVVVMIGALAFVAIPRMNMGVVTKHKAQTTAGKLASAIRKTRSLAITNAATNPTGFRLSMTGSSPYTGFEIIDLSDNSTVETQSIDSDVSCAGAIRFTFAPLGNRDSSESGTLSVSGNGKTVTITVTSITGAVKCSD